MMENYYDENPNVAHWLCDGSSDGELPGGRDPNHNAIWDTGTIPPDNANAYPILAKREWGSHRNGYPHSGRGGDIHRRHPR
jgi:hypothetical protein